MDSIEYVCCLHGRFFRFNVKADIEGFQDGYVDIEVSKRGNRISIHGIEHGSRASVVTAMTKFFNDRNEEVFEMINNG